MWKRAVGSALFCLCLLLAQAFLAAGDRIPVLFDDDGSPDGVIALLYLLSNPNVDVRAVTICPGEADPVPFADSLCRFLTSVETTGSPQISAGESAPLSDNEGTNCFPRQWRDEAAGFWGVSIPSGFCASSTPAVEAIRMALLEARDSKCAITILATGPLTNIATALRVLDPSLLAWIREIVIMGGALHVAGNLSDAPVQTESDKCGFQDYTANKTAEWNFWVDSVAAGEVLKSGIPIRLIPLDATNGVRWNVSSIADDRGWQGTPEGNAATELLRKLACLQVPPGAPCQTEVYLYDLVAAVVAVDPDAYAAESMWLDVGTSRTGTGELDQGQLAETMNYWQVPPHARVYLSVDSTDVQRRVGAVFGGGRDPNDFEYLVGVDYFPAFHYNATRFGDEWLPIKLAQPWIAGGETEPRRPLAYLGYYDDTLPATWNDQITLANKYGVGYFFIQYRVEQGATRIETDCVLDALLASTKVNLIRFAVNWGAPETCDYSQAYFGEFLNHVKKYLANPSYLRINGKPVVGLLHWHNFVETLGDRICEMQTWAKANGFPGGLYFVSTSLSPDYGEHLGATDAFSAGVDAVTNLAAPLAGTTYGDWLSAEGHTAPYATQLGALNSMWEEASVLGGAVFPFPNSGWDDTPWAARAKVFVRTGGNAEDFERQLIYARDFLDALAIRPRVVLVASWNEWGEGHFIEPCEAYGYAYLEAIGREFNGIDERIRLSLGQVPSDPEPSSTYVVFDDFICDGKTWFGYSGHPDECHTSGVCSYPTYYGRTAGLRITNLNPDGTLFGGVLSYVTTGKDPSFAKVTPYLDGSTYKTLEIRYRLSPPPSGCQRCADLTVCWTDDTNCPPDFGAYGYFNFNYDCSQTCWGALVADGNWHVLRLNLAEKWRDRIWSVQIELPHNSAPGITVDVDYVRFSTVPAAGSCPP